MKRRLEFSEGSSDKFWEVEVADTEVTTRWGRIGTAGQTKSKSYANAAAALTDAESQAAGKKKKGYREVEGSAAESAPATKPPAPEAQKAQPASATFMKAKTSEATAASATKEQPAENSAKANVVKSHSEVSASSDEPAPSNNGAGAHPRPSVEIDHQVLLAEKADASRSRNPWPHPLPSFEQGWKELRRAFKDADNWRNGPGHCVPYLAAPLRRVVADLSSPLPAERWTPLEAAVLMQVVKIASVAYPKNGDLLVEAIIARQGLAFCLEALLLTRNLEIGHSKSCLWVTRDRGRRVWYQHRGHRPWLAVRRHLTRATPAEYEQAHAFAQAWRSQCDVAGRALLAYAFPDEPWWDEDLDEALANPSTSYGRKVYEDGTFALLACATDLVRARELAVGGAFRPLPDMAWNLAFLHGDEAVPLLLNLSQHNLGFLAPLDHLPSLTTALCLKGLLEDRKARSIALSYYQAHPRFGLHALAQVVAGGGKMAEVARPLLLAMLSEHEDLVASLPERERNACEALLAKRGKQLPEAPADRLPALLVSPPWKGKRAKTQVTVIEGLSPPDYPEALHWKNGKPKGFYQTPPPRGADGRRAGELWNSINARAALNMWHLDSVSDETALALWNASSPETWKSCWDLDTDSANLLARLGEAALPRFWQLAESEGSKVLSTLEGVESPRVAPHMARAFGTQKFAKVARSWLSSYPRAAVYGLIPLAVGKPGKSRDEASAALRWLARAEHRELVLEIAREYQAEAAVQEVLDYDPLQLYPDKMPKLGDFLKLESLSRPALREGDYSLSEPALLALCQMLAFSSLDAPYPGLEMVRELCVPASLEETAWEIFASWLAAGAPAREKWAFFALGHFGGDESARRLVPMIRAWPQESGFARAEMGLDVLCAIGTDVALMHLNGMAQKLKSKALQERAQQRLDDIAARRGLSVEELSDRLVPDLDLDADGTRTLSFGPREFRVSFDELLRPIVLDGEGKVIKDLPKPGAKDDAILAAASVAAYKALKKDAKAIASIQIERLEQAMSKGRSWEWADFDLLLLRHPLMIHPVRRLLWQATDENGQGPACFRVAEDGTLADRNDELFTPPSGCRVRIPHPLKVEPAELKTWSEMFADYNILQPFPQLSRPCHQLKDSSATFIDTVKGLVLHAGRVLGLTSRGWVKGEVWDGGVMCEMEKPLADGLRVRLPLEPGIYAGGMSELGDQTLGRVSVVKGRDEKALPLGELDAITYSEIVYDLETLKSGKGGKV